MLFVVCLKQQQTAPQQQQKMIIEITMMAMMAQTTPMMIWTIVERAPHGISSLYTFQEQVKKLEWQMASDKDGWRVSLAEMLVEEDKDQLALP